MATAEEILASYIDEEALSIDFDTRRITIPSTVRNLGVESDDSVKRLYFTCPKMYGDFDMSTFDIRINYMNANREGDVYPVEDVHTEGDNIVFSWLIGRHATKYKGDVNFIVCMKLTEVDPESGNTIVIKEFNTTVANRPVLEGLETGELVVQENPDIIEEILTRLDSVQASVSLSRTIELPVDGWIGDKSPYSQIVTIDGVTPRSMVNFKPTIEQIVQLTDDGVRLYSGNDNGVVTIYALDNKPTDDYTMEVLVSEVFIK